MSAPPEAADIARLPGQDTVPGSMGHRREAYELRLVHAHDLEVAVGDVGELVVRTELPWSISHGYLGHAAASAAAWRNGWIHTGDLMRRDEAGTCIFHDRVKDAIRRRGENVSSFEVEREMAAHPGVAEVACAPASVTRDVDEEIEVWIVPAGAEPPPLEGIVQFGVPRMPHLMVPRCYEVIEALPKTRSMKVRKADSRERGNSELTWVMSAHGFRVIRTAVWHSREHARERTPPRNEG